MSEACLRRRSLRITLARCASAVRALMARRRAMAVLLEPSATSCRISRSRLVSVS
jgi:hypothetical protein